MIEMSKREMQAAKSEIVMPVTVEQIAAAIHRMSEADRNELLRLVPELTTREATEQSLASHWHNFDKARTLLQDVQGNLSMTVQEERDERG